MSRDEAIALVGWMVGRIGGGYHPDNKLSEYFDGAGLRSFQDEQLIHLQPLHDQMMAELGDEVYTIGLKCLSL